MMNNKELPPLEFDGKFSGYGFFDPRAFWEKAVVIDRGQKAVEPRRNGSDCTGDSTGFPGTKPS